MASKVLIAVSYCYSFRDCKYRGFCDWYAVKPLGSQRTVCGIREEVPVVSQQVVNEGPVQLPSGDFLHPSTAFRQYPSTLQHSDSIQPLGNVL